MLASDLTLLQHIYVELNFIFETTNAKSKDEVLNDAILFRAVVRSIEIIGEASKKLSEDFKDSNPGIEWKKIGRTRDILIHVYFALDNDIIWEIITDKLPSLQVFVAKFIPQPLS